MKESVRYQVPFLQVPDELLKDSRTTVYHIALFCVIAMHANREQRAWPSLSRLAKLAGCSRRKVVTTVADLETFGWLVKTIRWNRERGNYESTIYQLQQSLQGRAHDAPGVGHTVHQGSACGAPESDPENQTDIEPDIASEPSGSTAGVWDVAAGE